MTYVVATEVSKATKKIRKIDGPEPGARGAEARSGEEGGV